MNTVKRIFTLFVALQLVVAIVGLSIYSHACGCSGSTKLEYSLVQDCCHHTPQAPAGGDCCGHADSSCNNSNDPCNCTTEVTELSISEPFTATPTLAKVHFFPILYQTIQTEYSFGLNETQAQPIANLTKPPPQTGIEIVIEFCSLKIPFYLS